MSLSSFCVVSNALRLNLVRLRPEGSAPQKTEKKEAETMQKTMRTEGMMCGRCEMHVKKALEAIAGVEEATADHTAGTAVLILSAPVDDALLRQAVEAQDYTVLSVE